MGGQLFDGATCQHTTTKGTVTWCGNPSTALWTGKKSTSMGALPPTFLSGRMRVKCPQLTANVPKCHERAVFQCAPCKQWSIVRTPCAAAGQSRIMTVSPNEKGP